MGLLVVLLGVTPHTTALAAQDASLVGSRIRFRTVPTHTSGWFHGQVLQATDSGLTVLLPDRALGDDSVRFRWSEVADLSVSRGVQSNAVRGGLLGAALLGTTGAVVAGFGDGLYRIDCESNCGAGTSDAAAGALVLGLVGGLVGAGIGAIFPSERWEPLDQNVVSSRVPPRP